MPSLESFGVCLVDLHLFLEKRLARIKLQTLSPPSCTGNCSQDRSFLLLNRCIVSGAISLGLDFLNLMHARFSIKKGKAEPSEVNSLDRELLETNKSYILDCGAELFVWVGRTTSLEDRKSASEAAEVSNQLSLFVSLRPYHYVKLTVLFTLH